MRPDARRSEDADPSAWRTSLAITGVFVVLAGLFFWFGSGPWVGALHAGSYGDLAQMTGAAHDVWTGKLDQVYGSNLGLLALPLSFLAVLPLAPVLGAMNQPIPYHDAATLLAGSYILFLGSFVLHAVRKLARDLGIWRHLFLLQIVAAILVLLPEFEYGHLDDVLALTAVVYAIRRLVRREHLAAALMLSVAISFKQWAFMLAPLVIAGAPKGCRFKTAFVAALLPAVLTAVSIGLDGSSAVHAFFSAPPSTQLTGHPGFDPNWLGAHSSEASRLSAAVIALALGILCARITGPARFLAVVAVILGTRMFTETVNYSYYWSPALLFIVLALVVAEKKIALGTWAWSLAALLWAVPRGLDSSVSGWWECELLLLTALGVKTLRVFHQPSGRTTRQPEILANSAPVEAPRANLALFSDTRITRSVPAIERR